jgi:hypothetical protein
MWRAFLTAALLALPAAALTAQDGPAKGPPPTILVAQVDESGRPFLVHVILETVPVQKKVQVLVNNRVEERTVTVHVAESRTVRFDLDGDKARVFDAAGKRIAPKELRNRLKGPTAVLVSTDGKEVDSFYLRLARPETLVVVSPELARQAVPPGLPVPVPPAPPEKGPGLKSG